MEFVYLAVVLDAFSRRVIWMGPGSPLGGRSGNRGVEMTFPVPCLAEGADPSSDRVQYASNDYTGLLKEYGVRTGIELGEIRTITQPANRS